MSDPELKVKALELSNQHAATPDEIVARATVYHAFLSGANAAGKATPPTGKPGATGAVTNGKPGATAGKPGTPAPTGKPGATAGKGATPPTGKPGAGKPATKAPGGKHTVDEVRGLVRQVSTTEGLGKQSALDILDEEAGVQNVTNLKAEDYDKVYEACVVALNGAGVTLEGSEPNTGDATDDFDPTA